ncbi:MAG: methyltransferase domain-containing protein [Chitinophagaceae bacterium]|nr:methyltransferase domain-containing protein [Chitinophagaceae bacterium]MCW5905445.1 methyltransferase domain-containing protein [Chitinophagaceae bacterium]
MQSNYVIEGGKQGKERLNVLSNALEQYTLSLLQKCGVAVGNSFLDCGCGGGNVSIMAARLVGNTGKVKGIDADSSIIQLAKQDAQALQLTNITFEAISIDDIMYQEIFDTVYARFLLSHLNNPLIALQKMIAAAKPNGKIIVEEIQFSGHFCYPYNAAFYTYLELYAAVVKKKNGNAELGIEMPSLFAKTSLTNIDFDIIQPAFNNASGKWMAYITLDKIKAAIIAENIASDIEVENLLKELKTFTEDTTTMISLPRIFRVWGTKNHET